MAGCGPVIFSDVPPESAVVVGADVAISVRARDLLADDPTVTVSGLPRGLSYDAADEQIGGAVEAGADEGEYQVMVSARNAEGTSVLDLVLRVVDAATGLLGAALAGRPFGTAGPSRTPDILIRRVLQEELDAITFGTVAAAQDLPDLELLRLLSGSIEALDFGTVGPATLPELEIGRTETLVLATGAVWSQVEFTPDDAASYWGLDVGAPNVTGGVTAGRFDVGPAARAWARRTTCGGCASPRRARGASPAPTPGTRGTGPRCACRCSAPAPSPRTGTRWRRSATPPATLR